MTNKNDNEENASVIGSTPVSNDLIKRGRSNNKIKNDEDLKIKEQNRYEVIVVGAGVGGYVCAIRCAQLGLKTLVVEKENYGGVCLNKGCIPTKALLKSSKIYSSLLHSTQEFGITLDVKSVKADWEKIQERKNDIVNKLTGGVKALLKKNKIDFVKGTAKAVNKNTIQIDSEIYWADNLVIATGSVPNGMKTKGYESAFENDFVIDSTKALSLPKIPKSIIIIGGGVIGIEFASIYKNLGSKVTILQFLPTILEMLDSDVAKEMTKQLLKDGNVEIITNAETLEFKNNSVVFKQLEEVKEISADYCLVSVGRKTVTTGFEDINLKITNRNHIEVNDYCETNIEDVFAIGDVTGKVMLAHVASHQGIIVANRIAKKMKKPLWEDKKMHYDRIPSCVYTKPEIAFVGLTEDQVKKDGLDYLTYSFPFQAIGKALTDGDPTGFVKLICQRDNKKILGAHIISDNATEMISEITAVMESEGTISEIANSIHPHPTLSEAMGEAAIALEYGKPINF